MAASEVYDFVDTITPDISTTTFADSIEPQGPITTRCSKNVIPHIADDDSEERISLSTDTVFFFTMQWNGLTEAEAGTLFDFYNDSSKACGSLYSFQWDHPTDGHTYVCRFVGPFQTKKLNASIWQVIQITLKVLGRIAD